MSGASIGHNRKAVYSALARTFDDRMLVQQSFDYWEQQFSQRKMFRVSKFVEELVTNVGLLDEQRRKLSVALFADLARDESELPEVPKVVQDAASPKTDEAVTSSASEPVNRGDSATVVFSYLLTRMVEQVSKKDPALLRDLKASVKEMLSEHCPEEPVRTLVGRWAEDEFEPSLMPTGVAQSTMPQVVHLMYVSLCETLGPSQADRVLSRAKSAAEQLDQAEDFSPEQLL